MGRHAPRTRERAKGAGVARRRRLPPRALGHVQPCDACLGPACGGLAGLRPESGRATYHASPRRTDRAGARRARRAVVAPCRFSLGRIKSRRADHAAEGHALAARLAFLGPFQQGIERWAERLAPGRQAIFDLRRNLVVDRPFDHRVGFQLAKLLREHFLRDAWNCSFEIGEPQHLPAKEIKQDEELPAAVDVLQGLLDSLRRRDCGVFGTVTARCVTYFFVRSCHSRRLDRSCEACPSISHLQSIYTPSRSGRPRRRRSTTTPSRRSKLSELF